MEMKYRVRWKIVDEKDEVIGVWVSCHVDIKVKLEVFNELLKRGLAIEPKKPLSEYEVTPFKTTKGWEPTWKSIEEAIEIQNREEEDHQRSKIIREVEYGAHIPLKCKICGAKFHTKNIAPIGCRTIFWGKDFEKSVACDEAGHKLSDLEPQIKGGN
jgi:hypothetical protein